MERTSNLLRKPSDEASSQQRIDDEREDDGRCKKSWKAPKGSDSPGAKTSAAEVGLRVRRV